MGSAWGRMGLKKFSAYKTAMKYNCVPNIVVDPVTLEVQSRDEIKAQYNKELEECTTRGFMPHKSYHPLAMWNYCQSKPSNDNPYFRARSDGTFKEDWVACCEIDMFKLTMFLTVCFQDMQGSGKSLSQHVIQPAGPSTGASPGGTTNINIVFSINNK